MNIVKPAAVGALGERETRLTRENADGAARCACTVQQYDYKVAHLGCRAKPHEMVTLGVMQSRAKEEAQNDVEVVFGVSQSREASLLCCHFTIGFPQVHNVRSLNATMDVTVLTTFS